MRFVNNDPRRVIVLSIPDWGVTPFAAERETEKIAMEIDAYNAACKSITEKNNSHFIAITKAQRADGNQDTYLAADQLHPSGMEYAKWAQLVFTLLLSDRLRFVFGK